MTAIQQPQNITLAQVDFNREQLELIKTQIAPGASDGELQLFIEQCKRTGLDPLSRQIYAVMREENKQVNGQWVKVQKMAIQVAIDGFRVIAERHGQYAGRVGPLWCGPDGKWLDVWLSKDVPAAAKVGILRHGFREPLWAVARFDAYASRKRDGGLMGLWAKMPDVMIAKCAEAQALRAAFPNDLSGLYATEEMQQADNPAAEQERTPTQRERQSRDVTREIQQAAGTPEHTTRPAVNEEALQAWAKKISDTAERARKVAPEAEVQGVLDLYSWRSEIEAARATYDELVALGKKYAPAQEKVKSDTPQEEPASQVPEPGTGTDVVEAELLPAPLTPAQLKGLQTRANNMGASTSEKRHALWAYLLKHDAPLDTKKLSEDEAAWLLSRDVLGMEGEEGEVRRTNWLANALKQFEVMP